MFFSRRASESGPWSPVWLQPALYTAGDPMKFSPDYVRIVLDENFEDAKAQLLEPLMAIEYAHLVMLTDRQIVSRAEAASIRTALDAISIEEIRRVTYDGTYEDLFFYVERLVVAGCGENAAGRL